jgi:hypothetical protein
MKKIRVPGAGIAGSARMRRPVDRSDRCVVVDNLIIDYCDATPRIVYERISNSIRESGFGRWEQ